MTPWAGVLVPFRGNTSHTVKMHYFFISTLGYMKNAIFPLFFSNPRHRSGKLSIVMMTMEGCNGT